MTTLVLVVLGAYFVGEQVLHFIDRLQAFIQTVTKATTEAELDQAARYFAETMGSGLAMAQVLFTRSRARQQPSQVIRAHSKGGAGGKKTPKYQREKRTSHKKCGIYKRSDQMDRQTL